MFLSVEMNIYLIVGTNSAKNPISHKQKFRFEFEWCGQVVFGYRWFFYESAVLMQILAYSKKCKIEQTHDLWLKLYQINYLIAVEAIRSASNANYSVTSSDGSTE